MTRQGDVRTVGNGQLSLGEQCTPQDRIGTATSDTVSNDTDWPVTRAVPCTDMPTLPELGPSARSLQLRFS
jgi:hypothetical protein